MSIVDKRDEYLRRSEEAQMRFEQAFGKLSHQAVHQAKGAVKEIEQELQSSIHNLASSAKDGLENLSISAKDGIRGIKQELNVANAIKNKPWNWVTGAAVTGAAAALLFVAKTVVRKPRVAPRASKISRAVATTAAVSRLPVVAKKFSWPMLLMEFGMMLWKMRQNSAAPKRLTAG